MTRLLLRGLALLWLAAGSLAAAQDLQPVPALEARVTDGTGTLTAEQQSALEQKLAAFEARKGAQVAVLLVPTTQPEEIEQYSIRVVDQWKLGRKSVDDGALLIIAKDDRTMRIEVGRGLEGALTDATSKRIIAETITPLFRQGDFNGGISAGVDQIMRVIEGEPLPEPDRRWRGGESRNAPGFLPIVLFAVLIGAPILRSILGRGLGSVVTGGVTGGLVWFASQVLGFALFAGIGAAILSLVMGFGGGGRWTSGPRSGGWGGGLGGGGFGGGGFGGGGFGGGGFGGGGGGGFGGGGASGRW